uniref:Transferrin-like domain-containing protein n=1 Tax=Bos mutus grunniens TaxID=30521 RepID=A0A8C0A542_BOSMU
MRLVICSLLCAGALGLCLAVPERTVRWCTVSNLEASKCYSFHDNMKKVLSVEGPHVTCVKRTSYLDCIGAIAAHEADAVMVDGGLVYEAGLKPYNLKPVVAEFYGSKDDPQTHHYVVAVVKKGSNFQLNQLQGKKSCHTGLGWSTGWNIPMRMLLPSDWSQEAAAKFFAGSCVPCADQSNFPKLCQLCAGKGMDKCACSHHEPYFGYSGAFKCLQDGVGDVSFVRHLTVFAIPEAEDPQRVMWCSVGHDEHVKCNRWSALSGGILACTVEESTEDCIAAIAKGEADAMSLDGGFIYTAGKCGLVPVLAENYLSQDGKEQLGSKCVNTPMKGYYVVAVVKKSDANLTWNSLQGKKSCHTAVGTSAGWNIPMGFLYNQTGSCKLDEFFSQSCAPGSDPESSLCALCRGSFKPAHMCAPNSHEQYYGSSGALRCLVEKGDVAFVKHPTVLQNTDGKNPEAWAKNLKPEDFQLLCLDGSRKPVTEAQSCHLAIVPSHAVVSRKDKADFVRRMLFNQQELFGRNGFEYMMFQLFKSPAKDLLFSDDTECLANLQDRTTYQKYLGPEYLQAIANVKHCLRSELLDACTFHGN